ncbi:MAG: hypothetical protein SGILL_008522 [Bacillariaceae sp.]
MKFSTATIFAAAAIGSASAFSTPRSISTRSAPLFSSTIEKPEAATTEAVNGAAAEAPVVEEEKPAATPVAPEAPKYKASEISSAPAAVVIDKSKITPGRFDESEYSIAIPFLKRPSTLDGTHAGDFGFDPMGLTEEWDLYTMQEAELRHGRLAMLAVVGWPLSELVAPKWMLQGEFGCAPSVLNGFNPVSFLAVVSIFGALGFFEYKTALRKNNDTPFGKMHRADMSEVWQYGVAGDYNFDPLNLYNSLGDDAYARKGLREVEISHGRSAMLGITAFALWEALTGHPIVENSMFFHPNALLPLLVAGYVAFGQIYEFDNENSDTFFRYKVSSEGEARLENLKMGMGQGSSDSEESNGMPSLPDLPFDIDLSALSDAPEKIAAAASGLSASIDKLQDSYMENVVQSNDGEKKEYK